MFDVSELKTYTPCTNQFSEPPSNELHSITQKMHTCRRRRRRCAGCLRTTPRASRMRTRASYGEKARSTAQQQNDTQRSGAFGDEEFIEPDDVGVEWGMSLRRCGAQVHFAYIMTT